MKPRVELWIWALVAFKCIVHSEPYCINDPACTCNSMYDMQAHVPCTNVYCKYRDNNMTRIPTSGLQDLAQENYICEVGISNKPIKVIERDAFLNTIIFRLNLDENQIEEIEANAFSGCSRLRSLSLALNRIKILHPGSFQDLSILIKLDLSGQMIERIEPGVLVGLDSLDYLDLNLNQISQLEEGSFLGVSNLTYITVALNNLQVIKPHTFNNLPLINSLDMKKYGIKKLEQMAFDRLENLTKLILESNYMTDLVNDTFVGLPILSSLNIRSNKLISIETDAFRGLKSLTELDLADNLLTQINQYVFSDLDRLVTLDLSKNNLVWLEPDALHGLGVSLKTIDLSDNRFDKIASHFFSGLNNLTNLNLAQNLISSIEEDSFNDLTALTDLYLDDNCIFRIPDQLFATLFSIRLLNLDDNVIKKIKISSFERLPDLNYLFISQSSLSEFPLIDENSQELISLTHLDLSKGYYLKRLVLNTKLVYLKLDSSHNTELVVPSTFSNYNLRYLYISNFPNAQKVNFKPLTKLEELDLSGNEISDLVYIFRAINYNLQVLRLRNASFNFSLSLVANLPSLIELDVGMARFDLTEKLNGKLKSLRKLYLDNLDIDSNFTKRYFGFFNMNQLTHLDLSKNRLEYFPTENYVTNYLMSSIRYLNLRNNMIKAFNFDFFGTDRKFNIEWLDLGQNKLENISMIKIYSFGTYLNLTTILLDNNQFSFSNTFLGFFRILFSTKYLIDFSHNKITSQILEGYFDPNTNNKFLYLNLSNNLLESFNLSLFSMYQMQFYQISVKHIDLSCNRIKSLTNYSFRIASLLSFLNLSHNELTDLPAGVFTKLRALKVIDLNQNRLSSLALTIFTSQTFLRLLNLSSNQLNSSVFVPELLQYQSNMITLDISNNIIEHINSFLFQNLTALQNLYIHQNPIKMLDFLVGMDSIENIYFSPYTLDQKVSITNLHNSIKPRLIKSGSLNDYYKAVFVNYVSDVDFKYDEEDCEHILYLVRDMILLNLKEEVPMDKYLTECEFYFSRLFQVKSD